MAVEYASRLITRPSESAGDELQAVIDTVAAWADVSNAYEDLQRSGRRGSIVDTELFGSPHDQVWGWRLRFQHAHDRDPAVRWTVTVLGMCDGNAEVAIRLDRTRVDGVVVPARERAAPPGCVRALLESDTLEFVDGGRAMDESVWAVKPDQAEDFAAFVLSSDRRLPIFALTPRDEDLIDGGELLIDVLGLAHVALIRSESSWQLDRHLPKGFNVFGGAARLWWPGITPASSRWDHKLWTADVEARRLQHAAKTQILEAGRAAALMPSRFTELERAKRQRRTDALLAEVDTLRSVARSAKESAKLEQSSSADERVRDAEQKAIESLRSEVEFAVELAAAAEEEAAEARERASIAERQLDYWRSEAARLRDGATGGANVLEEDAALESDLLSEIQAEIDRRGSVDGAINRTYKLGSVFARTLAHYGERYRSKAIRACADVALGAPTLLGMREDHPLRVGPAGNDPQRIRAADGAQARRCSLERNTPAARRLHYWCLPDGTIEFATINVHEDMGIPE